MSDFLVKLAINTLAVLAAIQLVPGIGFRDLSENWPRLLVVAFILGLVNSYLRPIVRLLSLPVNLVAMGFVGFAINTAMVLVVAFVSGQLRLGFTIAGWPGRAFTPEVVVTALVAAIVISVVATALALARLATPRI